MRAILFFFAIAVASCSFAADEFPEIPTGGLPVVLNDGTKFVTTNYRLGKQGSEIKLYFSQKDGPQITAMLSEIKSIGDWHPPGPAAQTKPDDSAANSDAGPNKRTEFKFTDDTSVIAVSMFINRYKGEEEYFIVTESGSRMRFLGSKIASKKVVHAPPHSNPQPPVFERRKSLDDLRNRVQQLEEELKQAKLEYQSSLTQAARGLERKMWFCLGQGETAKAKEIAATLATDHKDTPSGEAAIALLKSDFSAVGAKELPTLIESTSRTAASVQQKNESAGVRVDLGAVQKAADASAKLLKSEQLVPAFMEAYNLGKENYRKATPGAENNQEHNALALEQFIRAERIYLRIEELKLETGEIENKAKEVNMLHFACLKMTILGH